MSEDKSKTEELAANDTVEVLSVRPEIKFADIQKSTAKYMCVTDLSLITPEIQIRDLIEDSLSFIEYIIFMEDQFEMDIPDEDLNRMIYFRDLYQFLMNGN